MTRTEFVKELDGFLRKTLPASPENPIDWEYDSEIDENFLIVKITAWDFADDPDEEADNAFNRAMEKDD